MVKRAVGMICVVICVSLACSGLTACRKLNESGEGGLAAMPLEARDHIPAEFGRLVAVTSNEGHEDWAQLWFEKPDKTIAILYVDFISGRLGRTARLIPRK